jgi:hypothetical protein
MASLAERLKKMAVELNQMRMELFPSPTCELRMVLRLCEYEVNRAYRMTPEGQVDTIPGCGDEIAAGADSAQKSAWTYNPEG